MFNSASRCINNSIILQKILESSDLLKNLQFRLVDKRFDREVLHRIRLSHRKIHVYVEERCLPKIKVNGSSVSPKDCFTFLINTAEVRVQELQVVTDQRIAPALTQEVEKAILKALDTDHNLNVFIGMRSIDDFCCARCVNLALRSKVYGPVPPRFLKRSFEEPKHFERLIVDDYLILVLAMVVDVLSYDQTRENHEQEKAEFFHSNISCDHLQLLLYNHPDFFEDGQRTPIRAALPREFLEEMCTKWRPKSIGLSVMSHPLDRDQNYFWKQGTQYLTEFRFFDPYESTRGARGFMLDHVNVDLDDAPLREIFKEDSSFFDDNLIANVRKVFPARHYFVNLHRMSICHQLNQCRLEHLIRAVIRGSNQSNTSPVTVRISIDITDKPFDIPETLSVGERVLTCSVSRNSTGDVFGTTRRIAKSFRISHKYTGLEMNLEIYVDKKQLEEAIGKHVELGFLKHYVD